MTIIIICVMAIVVVALILLIAKSAIAPKRVEALPKLITQGKTQKAIKLSKQLLQKDPKNYMANYYLGKAYLKEGKKELAILEYKHVNENALFGEQLNELDFRKEFAELLLKFNQQNEALKNYILLTKLEPKNAENYFQAGWLYEQQNRYDLALGFMQKAATIDKKHAKAHAEIGLMLYRTKQFNEAKKEIDLAIKLSPDTYSSYYYLGKILKDAKDLQSAIKAFEKAQRDPDVKQKAIIEHGSCFMIAGRYDSAMVDFQRAIDFDKNNEFAETLYARYFLAVCYEKSRKIDKAIEQWEEIYKRNKSFRDVSAKLSEYKDIQTNDNMKDYLTCSNEEFTLICKNAAVNGLSLQVLSAEQKKWGCQITGIVKSDDSWMNVRKQVLLIRFFREPEPIDEKMVMQTIDDMKPLNSTKSYIFSSSGFSQQAKRFAENRPVELIEKQKLEAVLSKAGSK
ncbi:MAG: tetratricopeptide repeat protein [Spirochaetia bacterium]|nr:tetratricopeptide repeat protein [Spirochaetia bacterium]MDD7269581.1 tetratricopeptide repeat protein [Treponema sp.]MDD7269610.1 tetratricopeptide repeat protein [Treponema sp.]MDY4985995.1 tetratricopeptide repeat protein [Treponema sp.]